MTNPSPSAGAGANVAEEDAVWRRLGLAQVRRRHAFAWCSVLVLCALPWIASAWRPSGLEYEGLIWFGRGCILAAIFGRAACMLYLGGHKGHALITDGPYAVSRNPLYVCSIVGVLGVGLQSASLVVGLVCAALAFGVFRWVVGEEERLMRFAFGAAFDAYRARVPRFWPRWALWQSPAYVNVELEGVWKTVRDALPYLLTIPLFALIALAQRAGWLHVILSSY